MSRVGRASVSAWFAAGSVGMLLLGTVEVWVERAASHVDASGDTVAVLLAGAPVVVMVSGCLLVHRRLVTRGAPALAVGGRTAQVASTGWALLTVAAVLLVQAVLFGASSVLVQEIGCGRSDDDWCGFGSGILGAAALLAGGTSGLLGSALWLVARRSAFRARRHPDRRTGAAPR